MHASPLVVFLSYLILLRVRRLAGEGCAIGGSLWSRHQRPQFLAWGTTRGFTRRQSHDIAHVREDVDLQKPTVFLIVFRG